MIILDDTDKSLEVVLDAAATTTELPVVVSYVDHDSSGETLTPANQDSITTGATPVTVCSAPGAGVERQIKSLFVYNADTVNAVVTVQYEHGATQRILLKQTLAPGATLQYDS